MYNTEKNPGFNLKDIIIKAIFLVLFILLLVWLFPKVPNMKPFYSNVFRENIKYMQDAAESYYTTEKLPKNLGDTAEMTLQDMIDKNLILPFVDEDGNSCDTKKSYVEVKKNKNDYTLKVNLVCPNEENFVEKTLGCYEYCEDCKEEEKQTTAIEYQFKQTGSKDASYYTCPDGGTLTNGICNIYTTDTYKATIVTTKGTTYCPNGGELKDGKCYVTKTTSYNASTTSGSYYCPNGGTLSGTKCYIYSNGNYSASINYTCPNGGTLSGSKCIIETTTSGSSYAASSSYYCPNGGTLSGSKCITSKGTQAYTYNATKKTTPAQTLTGNYTTKPAGATCSTTKVRACSTCTTFKTVYTSCYIPASTSYTCPNGGTLSGTTCKVAGKGETSYSASSKLTCPSGGSLSGSRCYTSGSTEISSYSASKSYYCPNGGTLSGTSCLVSDTQIYNATKASGEKYCPNGGTLSGDKCIKTETSNYKASVTDGTSTKTCPNGGSLKDDGLCYTTKLSKSYKATLNTKKQYYTNYKWSREESLSGWTRTGETRTVSAETVSNKQK